MRQLEGEQEYCCSAVETALRAREGGEDGDTTKQAAPEPAAEQAAEVVDVEVVDSPRGGGGTAAAAATGAAAKKKQKNDNLRELFPEEQFPPPKPEDDFLPPKLRAIIESDEYKAMSDDERAEVNQMVNRAVLSSRPKAVEAFTKMQAEGAEIAADAAASRPPKKNE